MIYCPNCSVAMKEVLAPGHYHQNVILNQCPKCGGLWFDAEEFYKIRVGHAKELENLDLNNLSKLAYLENKVFICPRDHTGLKAYNDTAFFKNLRIVSCSKCGGFWFNHGEFTKYQAKRAEKALKENRVEDLAEAILKLENFKENEKRKAQFQKFLAPVGSAAVPLGMIKTGDWRLDILFDIIGAVLKRIFVK